MSIAKQFIKSVDEEMVRLYGPEALARWNAIAAPDAVPGGDDLDETPEPGQAWPVAQGDGE